MTRFIIQPAETISLDVLRGLSSKKITFKKFKKFERMVCLYDGFSVWYWVYPDGHREIEMKNNRGLGEKSE